VRSIHGLETNPRSGLTVQSVCERGRQWSIAGITGLAKGSARFATVRGGSVEANLLRRIMRDSKGMQGHIASFVDPRAAYTSPKSLRRVARAAMKTRRAATKTSQSGALGLLSLNAWTTATAPTAAAAEKLKITAASLNSKPRS
jgi:hypothetical protein